MRPSLNVLLGKLKSLSYVINNFIIRNIILILDLLPIFTFSFIGVILNYYRIKDVLGISFFEYLASIIFLYFIIGILFFSIIFFILYLIVYHGVKEKYINIFFGVLLFLLYIFALTSNKVFAVEESIVICDVVVPSRLIMSFVGDIVIKKDHSIIGANPPIITADVSTSAINNEELIRSSINQDPVAFDTHSQVSGFKKLFSYDPRLIKLDESLTYLHYIHQIMIANPTDLVMPVSGFCSKETFYVANYNTMNDTSLRADFGLNELVFYKENET